MRSFLALAALSLLLHSCGSEPSTTPVTSDETTTVDSTYCDCSELTFDQAYNHFWRYEKRTGFTGKCEEYYANGKLKLSKDLDEGKLNGKVISYYDNGQVHEEMEFDKNLQVGEQITYTKKGEVKFHALYKNGVQVEILVNKPGLMEEDPWSSN